MDELNTLIRYSMNLPGQPPVYRDRGPGGRADVSIESGVEEISDEELERALDELDDTDDTTLITPEGERDMHDYESDREHDEQEYDDEELPDAPEDEPERDDSSEEPE
jgi:hypothetical protein